MFDVWFLFVRFCWFVVVAYFFPLLLLSLWFRLLFVFVCCFFFFRGIGFVLGCSSVFVVSFAAFVVSCFFCRCLFGCLFIWLVVL